MPEPLDAREQRFVDEYLIDLDVERAAIAAGYSESVARSKAYQWVSNSKAKPHVYRAIVQRQRGLQQKLHISQEAILAELAKLGFANMQDFLRVTSDGDPHFNLSDLTRDQAAALSEVTVEDFMDGRGEDARDVRRIKFKLADKRAALVDIGKHLGMFKERTDVSLTITHESALEQLDDAPDTTGDDATGEGTPPPAP